MSSEAAQRCRIRSEILHDRVELVGKSPIQTCVTLSCASREILSAILWKDAQSFVRLEEG